jgi:hypothetical protein
MHSKVNPWFALEPVWVSNPPSIILKICSSLFVIFSTQKQHQKFSSALHTVHNYCILKRAESAGWRVSKIPFGFKATVTRDFNSKRFGAVAAKKKDLMS